MPEELHSGPRDNSMIISKEEIKRSKLESSLLRSIDLYLTKKVGSYGVVFVEMIALSKDLRHARIYLKGVADEKPVSNLINRLNRDNREIFKSLKEQFESKYYPSLEFILINE